MFIWIDIKEKIEKYTQRGEKLKKQVMMKLNNRIEKVSLHIRRTTTVKGH